VLDRNCRTQVLRQGLTAAREAWLALESDEETKAKMDQIDFLIYQSRHGRFADFHAFRHATGTFLAAGGVRRKVAQAILRHSDIGLTMKTTATLITKMKQRRLRIFQTLAGGRRKNSKQTLGDLLSALLGVGTSI